MGNLPSGGFWNRNNLLDLFRCSWKIHHFCHHYNLTIMHQLEEIDSLKYYTVTAIFKVIQGQMLWYQIKERIQVPL